MSRGVNQLPLELKVVPHPVGTAYEDGVPWKPTRAMPGDAGFDLYCQEDKVRIAPGEFRDIHCGVRAQLPEGWWGMLTGRSSTLRKKGLLVHTGVIDNGYRGPLFAGVWNLTNHEVFVCRGERVAQFIPIPIFPGLVAVVDSLEVSERGARGFGSSGR